MRLSTICAIITLLSTGIGAIAEVVGRKDEIREVLEEDYGMKPIEKKESD